MKIWHKVGRVNFLLAENPGSSKRPFVFLATYATTFGAERHIKHLRLSRAIEQYSRENNRQALISLLTPIKQMAETLDWVGELVDSNNIFLPVPWTVDQAHQFLLSAETLETGGICVRLPNWWKTRPLARISVIIGEKKKVSFDADCLLDFDIGLALGDKKLSFEDMKELLAGNDGLILFKGEWIEVDRKKLQEALEQWENIRETAGNDGISFIDGMRLLAGFSGEALNRDDEENSQSRQWAHVEAGAAMRRILADLRNPGNMNTAGKVEGLHATLRKYQKEGLVWLKLLTQLGLGACLADDMGLGKTIQALALLLSIRVEKPEQGHPSLLVIPASLLGNWKDEAERFTPSLKLLFAHPAENSRATLEKIAESPKTLLADTDLVVTTYSMVARQKWLTDMDWRLVILDEAQAIKNASTQHSKAVKKLSAKSRIIMTGTPVENRLGDLWSLFDFLNPGLLGSMNVFKSFIREMEAREDNTFSPLRDLISPYILRRLKTDRRVIVDLPDKTETSCYCLLSRAQVTLYQNRVKSLARELEFADGIARRGLVLRSIINLKQICNHPSQFTGDEEYNPAHSGKFQRIAEICKELAESREKVLIFTQFKEIIEPLADHLAGVFKRSGLVLHGGIRVNKRKSIIDQFQKDDGPPFIILSLKVGGTGLNLTAASHVIHFDRWWNPAVENQATDRAFRIGQKKNVWVHKFITRGTIEERIDKMIIEKRELADQVLSGEKQVSLTELSDDELLNIVRLDVSRATL